MRVSALLRAVAMVCYLICMVSDAAVHFFKLVAKWPLSELILALVVDDLLAYSRLTSLLPAALPLQVTRHIISSSDNFGKWILRTPLP